MKKFKSQNIYKKYHVLVLNKDNEFDEGKIAGNLIFTSLSIRFSHLTKVGIYIGNFFSQTYSLYKKIVYKLTLSPFSRMGNEKAWINNKILLLLGTLLTSNITLANNVESSKIRVTSDLDMKLRAYAAFESGFSSQSNLKQSEKKVSTNKEGFAFYNDAALFASISNKVNEIEYGGKIILVPTSKRKSNPAHNGSHIFVKSSFGSIELGAPVPAARNMMIGDGSIPGKYIKKSTDYLKQEKSYAPSFLTGNKHFLGDDIVASLDNVKYSNEPPRTINYYTPSIKVGANTKVQLGISYTPDSSNTGAGELVEKSKVDKKKIEEVNLHRFEIDKSVTDAVTAGIKLEQDFSNNIRLKVALTGEYGKTSGKAKKFAKKDDKHPIKYKLANLKSYNIGSELKINDFTFNACYGNLGKSFTTPEFHKSGTKSYYYNAGVAYKYNATTTKLSYFGSTQYQNTEFTQEDKGFLDSLGQAFPIFDHIMLDATSGLSILDPDSQLIARYMLMSHLEKITIEIKKGVYYLKDKQMTTEIIKDYEAQLDSLLDFAHREWNKVMNDADRVNDRADKIWKHIMARERS